MATAEMEDSSDTQCAPQCSASPVDPPSEKPPEACAEGLPEEVKQEEEKTEGEEEPDAENGEDRRLLGCLGLAAASCCVCVKVEQLHSCVRSEKICILPILACLLSLALCTAGLKWVFVDKIFEYEPPTHLDPKPMGQDPIIIDADPTLNLPVSFSSSTTPPLHPANTTTADPPHPEVFVEGDSTVGPFVPASPKVTKVTTTPKVTVRVSPGSQPTPNTTTESGRNNTPSQHLESNYIVIKTSTISTTPSAKTSSHMTPCSEEKRSYCVNGGECFTLYVTPNSTKHLCKCLPGFTGIRCQTKDPVRVTKQEQAEEVYQKRVLTITGICIALLVVGIMCVVAYCKTKKQRQKLHDRLRQSIRKRNTMADVGNGPQYPQNLHTPPQSLQLVNQYGLKNPVPAQHVIEKETETSFTTSHCISATHPPTAVSRSSSQCWSEKKRESVVSDNRAISGVSSAQNSRNGTPSRGRLNATGGGQDVSAYMKHSRETPDSYKESPYSERYVSTVTTPTRLSPVKLLSPATPSSPPSEMSAALPSLATSVPSMATSPLGEEERPLLFLTPPPLREQSEPSRVQQLRNSAHYNHGLDELSPPPSPLHIQEEERHQSTQEGQCAAVPKHMPQSPTAMPNSSRTKPGSQNSQEEQKESSGGSSESSSSESEMEEDRMSEDTPFLIQNPAALGMAVLGLEVVDSSRTNAALRLSPQDDLQSRLASVMVSHDPIAV